MLDYVNFIFVEIKLYLLALLGLSSNKKRDEAFKEKNLFELDSLKYFGNRRYRL